MKNINSSSQCLQKDQVEMETQLIKTSIIILTIIITQAIKKNLDRIVLIHNRVLMISGIQIIAWKWKSILEKTILF